MRMPVQLFLRSKCDFACAMLIKKSMKGLLQAIVSIIILKQKADRCSA